MASFLRQLLRAVIRAPRAAAAVLAGLLTFGLSAAVFLDASEDVVGHDGATRLDPQRLSWFVDHRSGPLVAAARFIDTGASVAVVGLLAVVVGIWLWRRGLPVVIAAAPLVAVVTAEVVAALLKTTVGRSRPPVALRLVTETEPSFPSGHATAATAFGVSVAVVIAAYVLVRWWPRVLVLAAGFTLPVIVGLSRLELGVHWPTDVAAGLALGTCAALGVVAASAWFAGAERSPGHASRPVVAHARDLLLTRRQVRARAAA